ncbi:MAG: HAD hydrolase-like protein [Bacteroidota bacterium]
MQINKTIFWDWNGTLLNDMHVCVDAMNILLRERNKMIIDEQIYREIFTFPVRDYYTKAGFDFRLEPFEKPALEFIEHYDTLVRDADLFGDVRDTLQHVQDKGYNQLILSAAEHDFLNELVTAHGISHYFRTISGIDNHYAAGKTDNALKLINSLDGEAGEVILIGDTIHDHEVGEELGIRVILVSRGHQSEKRLKETRREVVGDLRKLMEII